MANYKFLFQPGYIYDLIMIYVYRFNRALWNTNFVNPDKAASDNEYLQKIMSEFSDIPDDLLAFFYLKNDSVCFLKNSYLFNSENELINDFNFEKLLDKLSDSKILAEKMLHFYFPESDIKYEISSRKLLNNVTDLIEASSYPDILKHRLLSFFINPYKMTKKLVYELIAKEALLSKYYESNYKFMECFQEKFNFDDFTGKLNNIDNLKFSLEKDKTVYISLCLIAKNTVLDFFNKSFFLIGYDYSDRLNMLLNRSVEPELDIFGKIISEKNRIIILDLLNIHDEQSTSDIAKYLSVSVNAAYYHLDMMLQSKMLHARNEGRTVFYRLNRKYFAGALKVISKYGVK